jgi:hypothetical protein
MKTHTFPRLRIAGLLLACGLTAGGAAPADDLARARRVLAQTILFDGHNDLPWAIRTDK